MSRPLIIVGGEFIYFPSSDNITSQFYVEDGEMYFPHFQWTDFVIPLLNIWSFDSLRLQYADNTNITLNFMSGPYKMILKKGSDMQIELECIDGSKHIDVRKFAIKCNYFDWLRALYDANKSLSYYLYIKNMHHGKHSSDYNQSLENLHELRIAIDRVR